MNAINSMVWAMALLCALVLTGTSVSLFALYRAHALLRKMNEPRPEPTPAIRDDDINEIRDAVQALAAQVHEAQRVPPSLPPEPQVPRPALNLTKRSQALRMHRRGENPGQIASTLELPRQEVDLLLKVHRIVMSNV